MLMMQIDFFALACNMREGWYLWKTDLQYRAKFILGYNVERLVIN